MVRAARQAQAQELERSRTTAGVTDFRTSYEAVVHFTQSQATADPAPTNTVC